MEANEIDRVYLLLYLIPSTKSNPFTMKWKYLKMLKFIKLFLFHLIRMGASCASCVINVHHLVLFSFDKSIASNNSIAYSHLTACSLPLPVYCSIQFKLFWLIIESEFVNELHFDLGWKLNRPYMAAENLEKYPNSSHTRDCLGRKQMSYMHCLEY